MKNVDYVITKNNLINEGETIGVACSGGRDSMCLLHFLFTNKDVYKCKIIAVNIDHNIRVESAKDSKFVMEYCKRNNIECLSYSLDVVKYCNEKKMTLEEGAREARYNVFRNLIASGKVDKIALAHHQQDQSETVLLNIFRGTGLSGASGMEYGKGKTFIRPMLSTSRTEIQAYIEKNNIPYVDDETNFKNDYARNYIRNMIMPLVRNMWPNADASICKFADICRQDDKYISTQASDTEIESKNGVVKIKVDDFIKATPVINRIIRNALKNIGIYKDIEKKHLDLIRQLALTGENGSKINLPNNLLAYKEYNYIILTNKKYQPEKKTWKLKRGKIDIQEYGIITLSTVRKFDFTAHNHIIDNAKIPKDAVIRFREPGDVFEKFGGGTKSLSDYLIDKKVPTRLRNVLPVLASGNEILVVFGVEISNKVKVDSTTKTAWAIDIFRY